VKESDKLTIDANEGIKPIMLS